MFVNTVIHGKQNINIVFFSVKNIELLVGSLKSVNKSIMASTGSWIHALGVEPVSLKFFFPISEHLFEYIGTQFPPPSAILYGKMSSISVFFFQKNI